ncbi:hypothetical protein NOK12_16730 [Nocardioides sp. OK12]|uniref:hypothetical protein n=1 Tax=Nocardioides sp. OK12 TaxID=2758661 RepID=UPI0021C3830F|nr:hypothetical protein [Nocardioides sp. OK12]GHJ59155.1 hypothetical protein NOK12_16730 [Nocardioides sp. OK12]
MSETTEALIERVLAEHQWCGYLTEPDHRAHVAAAIAEALAGPSHVRRAHNHRPYDPPCNERAVGPHLTIRGACLNDDGSDR